MDEEEPAWRAELGEALTRIAWDIERGNSILGGVDYARRDLEDTVLDAIKAAEERGRREALASMAAELRTRFAPDLRPKSPWIDGWLEAADYMDPAKSESP